MVPALVILWSFAALATADWTGNINYGSPSLSHNLGLSMKKVMKRHGHSDWSGSYGDSKDASYSSGDAPTADFLEASMLNFTHGVASGDPYPDSVILWTRASPKVDNNKSNATVQGTVPLYNHELLEYVYTSTSPVCVSYAVSTDRNMSNVVSSGRAYTSSDIDYTVKVEAKGLKPWTQYYYQFSICGSDNKSPLGRTKTTPWRHQDIDEVSVAVYSCSNFPYGFFNAYGNVARKDNVDYVIHLGDYIYEYETSSQSRPVEPQHEIFTLYDYRRRIATYRTDQDLALSHQQFAWITTWDDHEIANNGYRDGFSGLNNTEASFEEDGMGVSVDQRKMNAVRAYFEWMPIRQVDMDNNLRIWRSFQFGSLFDLVMLDTRNYDRSITTLGWNDHYITELLNHAGRTLMGSLQENWFYNQLVKSFRRGATWRLIGSQIVFSRVNITTWFGSEEDPYNADAWDGYMANKNRTLKTMYDHGIDNNIMLAGDSHLNWVSDLVWLDHSNYSSQTGSGAVGVEFAGAAVSSSSPFGADSTIAECNNQSRLLIRDNEELQWQEGYYRGYYQLQISPQEVNAEYFGLPSLLTRNGYEVSLANFTVEKGANRLSRPVAGGSVENGALQNDGNVLMSNVTHDTETGECFVHDFSRVTIDSSS
ncbi:hypothetical protein KC333_g6075 [Hortaea werneckii]|nr:hypothetical protein KC333_g6075 [Hortaea werneckii]KAI7312376.1 hypothetical protein KC326_g5916 [Hortaea werneckii]